MEVFRGRPGGLAVGVVEGGGVSAGVFRGRPRKLATGVEEGGGVFAELFRGRPRGFPVPRRLPRLAGTGGGGMAWEDGFPCRGGDAGDWGCSKFSMDMWCDMARGGWIRSSIEIRREIGWEEGPPDERGCDMFGKRFLFP